MEQKRPRLLEHDRRTDRRGRRGRGGQCLNEKFTDGIWSLDSDPRVIQSWGGWLAGALGADIHSWHLSAEAVSLSVPHTSCFPYRQCLAGNRARFWWPSNCLHLPFSILDRVSVFKRTGSQMENKASLLWLLGKQQIPLRPWMWLRLVDQSVAFSYSENLNLGTHLLKHVKWSLLGAPTPQLPLLTVVLWRLNTTYQGAAGSAWLPGMEYERLAQFLWGRQVCGAIHAPELPYKQAKTVCSRDPVPACPLLHPVSLPPFPRECPLNKPHALDHLLRFCYWRRQPRASRDTARPYKEPWLKLPVKFLIHLSLLDPFIYSTNTLKHVSYTRAPEKPGRHSLCPHRAY